MTLEETQQNRKNKPLEETQQHKINRTRWTAGGT